MKSENPDGVAAAASIDAEGSVPEVEIPLSDLRNELSVLATLISSGLARSHPDAKRKFRELGICVNDVAISSDKAKLRHGDVKDGVIKLSLGPDLHVLLRPV